MAYNTTLFEDYLKESLRDIKINNNKNLKIWFIFLSIIEVVVVFICIMVMWANRDYYFLIIPMIIITIPFVIVWVKWSSSNKKNKQQLKELLPKDIYKKYYELVFPNNVLQFNELTQSDYFPGMFGMKFNIKGENIWWDIREHEETRVITTGKTTTTYTVYITNYILRMRSERLKGYEPIFVTTNSSFKKFFSPSQNVFHSASISFNQKYRVVGNNELQITKLFSPKVIDFFDNQVNVDIYNKHPLHIENGYVYTEYRTGEKVTPLGSNINKFQYLKINKDNYIEEITNRITKDFDLFFENLYLFRPFDLYRIYQNNQHEQN